MTQAMSDWQSVVLDKRKQVESLIPLEWRLPESITAKLSQPLEQNSTNLIALDIPRKSGILSEKELEITEKHDVRALLDALAAGKFSSEEVVTAFCKRAAIAQELTHCLTETYYSQAIERAKSLDKLRTEGKLGGPLHGLPISIKDMFDVAGSDTTIGFVSFVNKPKTESAVLVKLLEEQGAVIFCKTNIPQTLTGADSNNNVFGRTLNPHNTILTAGGSSGGEGALIAMRGSILGIGTDIGGSIRIPALCCGIYGFKPSTGRVPVSGWTLPTIEGFLTEFFVPCAGPLGPSVDALDIFMKTVLDAHPAAVDLLAMELPWRDLEPLPLGTKLRIGLLPEDPIYPLHPPMKRALEEATRLLRVEGHSVIPLDASMCHTADAGEIFFEFLGLETNTMREIFESSGEPLTPAAASGLLKPASFGNYQFLPDLSNLDLMHKIAVLNTRRSVIKDDWRKLWYGNNLDVVIGPGAQGTAVRHDTYGWPPYTCLQNLLDYPASIIPFGTVNKAQDPDVFKVGEGHGPDYVPQEVDGIPLHLQISTRTLCDEQCLRYTRLIDQCLNKTK